MIDSTSIAKKVAEEKLEADRKQMIENLEIIREKLKKAKTVEEYKIAALEYEKIVREMKKTI